MWVSAYGTQGLGQWWVSPRPGPAEPDEFRARLAYEHMFATIGGMTRWDAEHEIEHLRRSLAMLPVGAGGLDREDAIEVLARLRDLTARLRRLEAGLRSLLADEHAL